MNRLLLLVALVILGACTGVRVPSEEKLASNVFGPPPSPLVLENAQSLASRRFHYSYAALRFKPPVKGWTNLPGPWGGKIDAYGWCLFAQAAPAGGFNNTGRTYTFFVVRDRIQRVCEGLGCPLLSCSGERAPANAAL